MSRSEFWTAPPFDYRRQGGNGTGRSPTEREAAVTRSSQEADRFANLITSITGFRAARLIGSNSDSLVVSAVDVDSRQSVALKLFKRRFSDEPTRSWSAAVDQGGHEWGVHPGIADTFQHGLVGPYRFIARELVQGWSIQTILECSGRLTMRECLDLSIQVVEILEVAHSRQKHHGNITPANVFVEPCGNVRLTDWNECSGQWENPSNPASETGRVVADNALLDLRQLGSFLAAIQNVEAPSQRKDSPDSDEGEADLVQRLIREFESTRDPHQSLGGAYQELLMFFDRHRFRRRSKLSQLAKDPRLRSRSAS